MKICMKNTQKRKDLKLFSLKRINQLFHANPLCGQRAIYLCYFKISKLGKRKAYLN